jgi:hypothetical protein
MNASMTCPRKSYDSEGIGLFRSLLEEKTRREVALARFLTYITRHPRAEVSHRLAHDVSTERSRRHYEPAQEYPE